MHTKQFLCFLFVSLLNILYITGSNNQKTAIIKKDKEFQLLVQGRPFLLLGGELGNSSASDTAEMKQIWPRLSEMHLNTALVPIYWELVEPTKGRFDFTLVDEMVRGARESNLKLVLLWFGTWKNSMSCYAPEWVKKDYGRFPRTTDSKGKPSEIVTAFSENILQSDIKAFTALMKHIKELDAERQTVIMVQVENEIGQLPQTRDYSPLANKAFEGEVPKGLIDYLNKNKASLLPHVKALWASNGYRQNGNWEHVFGKGFATDEVFTAWHYAVFANKVTEAGKAVYDLPMYVNCALNRPDVPPGKYPSGGPLPHLIDIWQAGAPRLDMLSPDIYHGDFRHWSALYDRTDNPLFIPEIRQDKENPAQVFYVIGRHKGLGFCPFAIEASPTEDALALQKSYRVLDDLSDLLLEHRPQTNGAYLDKQTATDTLTMGDYRIVVAHVCTLPSTDGAKAETWTPAGCVIIQTGPDEFWVGGTSVVCTFQNIRKKDSTTGILSADACTKEKGNWHFKRLNGDQTHQGRHIRMGSNCCEIQRVRLYDYK